MNLPLARRRPLIWLSVPLIALSALTFAAHPATALAAAALTPPQQYAAHGDRVTVTGYGFEHNGSGVVSVNLLVVVNGHETTRQLQSAVQIGSNGALVASLDLPSNTMAGEYTIVARDFANHRATSALIVLPVILLHAGGKSATTTVVAGGFFFASGSGFKSGENVLLSAIFPLYDGNSVECVKPHGHRRQ